MSILSDLAEAWPLALIVGSAGFVAAATYRLDPKADEHDVSDYHEPARIPAPRKPWAETDAKRKDVIWNVLDDDILPPAPPGMDAGSPLYAGMLFDTWRGGESAEDTAARFLREIRDEALVGAR